MILRRLLKRIALICAVLVAAFFIGAVLNPFSIVARAGALTGSLNSDPSMKYEIIDEEDVNISRFSNESKSPVPMLLIEKGSREGITTSTYLVLMGLLSCGASRSLQ